MVLRATMPRATARRRRPASSSVLDRDRQPGIHAGDRRDPVRPERDPRVAVRGRGRPAASAAGLALDQRPELVRVDDEDAFRSSGRLERDRPVLADGPLPDLDVDGAGDEPVVGADAAFSGTPRSS